LINPLTTRRENGGAVMGLGDATRLRSDEPATLAGRGKD
jgi:hypothetical protein